MRTTIRLPDELYRDVRMNAAASGRSVTSFIEEALREALVRQGERRAQGSFRVRPFAGDGLCPGVELTDSAALLDLMESR